MKNIRRIKKEFMKPEPNMFGTSTTITAVVIRQKHKKGSGVACKRITIPPCTSCD